MKQLIRLFYHDPNNSYSIRSIAQKLNKAYSYVYGQVNALAQKGVLKKRKFGAAIYCSLNYGNDDLLRLLIEIEGDTWIMKQILLACAACAVVLFAVFMLAGGNQSTGFFSLGQQPSEELQPAASWSSTISTVELTQAEQDQINCQIHGDINGNCGQ